MTVMINQQIDVGVAQASSACYVTDAPFHPRIRYPELTLPWGRPDGVESPYGYALVRDALFQLGLDAERLGTPQWNPLREIVRPGDLVVLKPNWVLDTHPRGEDIFSVITHPSILRAVVDFVLLALAGNGEIVVCDAPQAECDFENLRKLSQLDSLREFYARHSSIVPSFVDLRKTRYFFDKDGYLKEDGRIALTGDPRGYRLVNLGALSLLSALPNLDRLYGADYDRSFTTVHHQGDRHEYLVSATVLSANVVISIPKMKTHKKTGVTLNLKNLVGINGDKNYLAHFRVGTPASGGDEYPDDMDLTHRATLRAQRALVDTLLTKPNRLSVALFNVVSRAYRIVRRLAFRTFPPPIRLGDWYGNDTAWRMVVDLNRILFLADRDGKMQATPQRRYFSVIDGVLAGEGNGPLDPTPRHTGLVLAGSAPTEVDLVATTLMGFNYRTLRLYDAVTGRKTPSAQTPFRVGDPEAISLGYAGQRLSLETLKSSINVAPFNPHVGWLGKIEEQVVRCEIKSGGNGATHGVAFWGDFDPAAVDNPQLILAVSQGRPLVVNCESAVTSRPISRRKLQAFRADPKQTSVMRAAGVVAACVANNHTLDCDLAGLRDTIDCLKKESIAPFGYLDARGEHVPAIISVDGKTIGLLGYVEFGSPLKPIFSLAQATKDIASLRPNCDTVAVYLHGGVEYVATPSPSQIRSARGLIDAGADLALWCHAHVRGAGERYRQGYICYGLGNSFFSATEEKSYLAASEGVEVALHSANASSMRTSMTTLRRPLGSAIPERGDHVDWSATINSSPARYLASAGPVYIGLNTRAFAKRLFRHPWDTSRHFARWLLSRMFWRMALGCALAPVMKALK